MKFIGTHVDTVPDLGVAPLHAAELGATAFALNLTDGSPRRSAPLVDDVVDRFRENCALHGFTAEMILPHASFMINLGSPDSRKMKMSQLTLTDEMRRAAQLGLTMINFHPGAHMRQIDEAECLARISRSINRVLADTEGVTAVIENTAGQGSNMGYAFDQIARILDGVDDRARVGVCVDTAHAFAAGYDLSTDEGFDRVWDEFDSLIGFDMLRGLHLNDSARVLGSRIDRHAPLGHGEIGQACFDRIAADRRFDRMPLILETPDAALWQAEVARLLEISQNAK
ncbi:MAG: deoxyribonuclease IV [Bacteroidales bacterium]|nr:deoxyribonuclease IV [Bacteroidales bacterium]